MLRTVSLLSSPPLSLFFSFLLLEFWIFLNEIFSNSKWKTAIIKLPGRNRKQYSRWCLQLTGLPQAMPTREGRETKMCFSISAFPTAPRRPPGKAVTFYLILHSWMPFANLLFGFQLTSWRAQLRFLILIIIFLTPVLTRDSIVR